MRGTKDTSSKLSPQRNLFPNLIGTSHHLGRKPKHKRPPQPQLIPSEKKETSEPITPEIVRPLQVEEKEELSTSIKLEIQNSEPATVSMEVHKHPHHVLHEKKWTEYLREFFMIFFAVFPGFLAETFREHTPKIRGQKSLL